MRNIFYYASLIPIYYLFMVSIFQPYNTKMFNIGIFSPITPERLVYPILIIVIILITLSFLFKNNILKSGIILNIAILPMGILGLLTPYVDVALSLGITEIFIIIIDMHYAYQLGKNSK